MGASAVRQSLAGRPGRFSPKGSLGGNTAPACWTSTDEREPDRRSGIKPVRRKPAVVKRTGTGRQINTSYIERINATFRSRLASLVRRGRGLAHKVETLERGMYLVGCVYNLCTEHRSLRISVTGGATKWRGRTPAMAAGWTDQVWSVRELLAFRPPMSFHG